MHIKVLCCCLLALVLGMNDVKTAAAQDIRFSEIHYDNAGTDAGESIEIEGPAGASVDPTPTGNTISFSGRTPS